MLARARVRELNARLRSSSGDSSDSYLGPAAFREIFLAGVSWNVRAGLHIMEEQRVMYCNFVREIGKIVDFSPQDPSIQS